MMTSLFRKQKEQPQVPFKYNVLEAGEIRLVQLKPSEISSRTPSGSLITISLQDSKDAGSIEYEALSYVWGVEPADRFIVLNGNRFPIKPNLEAALKVLNKGKADRLLWVDSICINQGDINERNEQVRLMRTIYQRAQRVVIWIGDSPGKTEATEIIRRFANYQRQGKGHQWLSQHLDNPHQRKETERHMGLFSDYTEVRSVDVSGGHWPALVEFFDRDWWRRVWVRQELVVSRNAVVLYGSLSAPWIDVAATCHWIKVWTADLDTRTKKYRGQYRSGVYAGEDLEYFRQTSMTKGNLDFETMFIHARNCEATDPRDKVFAILGLLGDDETENIAIDYSLPISTVSKQAFRKLVSKNSRLEALIFSQNPTREQDIPSWAPNLCSPFNAQPSRLKGQSSSIYAAAKGSIETFSFLADGNTLSVKGMIFDTIQKVSPLPSTPSKRGLLFWAYDNLDFIASVWRPLLFTWLGTMEIDQKYERLMRTITCDRDIRGHRMVSRENGLDWTTYFRFEHLGVRTRTEFEYLAAAVHGSRFEGAETDQSEVDAWVRLCGEAVGSKRMVLTSEGRPGLVPAEVQPWDCLCLILGLDVPFVLRKVDADVYVLVGEAYFYGVMDGEILGDGSFEVQDIWLQ